MSIIRTFILPILTYGLEIVLPKGKYLDNINRQYKKWIKQILSLYINVADPAVFILAGTLQFFVLIIFFHWFFDIGFSR
jgi:hypothetical protein